MYALFFLQIVLDILLAVFYIEYINNATQGEANEHIAHVRNIRV